MALDMNSEIDDAARRRYVKRLYIPLPEAEDRAQFFEHFAFKKSSQSK